MTSWLAVLACEAVARLIGEDEDSTSMTSVGATETRDGFLEVVTLGGAEGVGVGWDFAVDGRGDGASVVFAVGVVGV